MSGERVATGSKKNRGSSAIAASFTWTADEIESYKPPAPKQIRGDDMDSKIARVQARKKEAAERAERLSKLPKEEVKKIIMLSKFPHKTCDQTTSNTLCNWLNDYFDEVIIDKPELVSSNASLLPLNLYVDDTYSETLTTPAGLAESSLWAACLVTKDEPESSPRNKGLGRWVSCEVAGQLASGEFSVVIPGDSMATTIDRLHLCFPSDDIMQYGKYVSDAMERRSICIALMRYEHSIKHIPFDNAIISSLYDDQANRVVDLAFGPNSFTIGRNVADDSVKEARKDYEHIMKKLIYNSNMINATNATAFEKVGLPQSFFKINRIAPPSGVVEAPQHRYKSHWSKYSTEGYLSSAVGIKAMQDAVALSVDIQAVDVFHLNYHDSMDLSAFERFFSEQLMIAVRSLKQQWPSKTGTLIRSSLLQDEEEKYNCDARDGYKYAAEDSNDKFLVNRMNYMMSDVLTNKVRDSLRVYEVYIARLCKFEVEVDSIKDIKTILPADSIYYERTIPPLFLIGLKVMDEKVCLNQPDVDAYLKEYGEWAKTKEAKEGGKCPIPKVEPYMGFTFEYSNNLQAYKTTVLEVFDSLIAELVDVPHLEKAVMEKIFFPSPRTIPSASADEDLIKGYRERIASSVEYSLQPLIQYLSLFKGYEHIVNVDNKDHIEHKIEVHHKDEESTELELPYVVSVAQVMGVIEGHQEEMKEIKESLPAKPLTCGLFSVDVKSIRDLLLEKHQSIINDILKAHVVYCHDTGVYLEEEFRKILKHLAKRPENIEELTEMEEYIEGLKGPMKTLEEMIAEMEGYFGVLDTCKYQIDYEMSASKWTVMGMPGKIAQKIEEVKASNETLKNKQNEEMAADQIKFVTQLVELEQEVVGLEQLVDLEQVKEISTRVKTLEVNLAEAQEKARLFNSRETLFEADLTDYEDLSRVVKMFEPFAGLWQTANDWTNLFASWVDGPFVNLEAEEMEKLVEKFSLVIAKTTKYFNKQGMDAQADIATLIKKQIEEFKPEVPMIVSLRNPGMRERHWEALSKELNVQLNPIEDFTTRQILDMDLKKNIELIQKIGESAAKEFQIETALNKMEGEWAEMILQVKPYRETGTGVLTGIDDINLILDEQITMTQTIMFSAFKGPFEERIDIWNKKLCNVSDLLEVWVAVQRNWLYLQPIFESPDINRQLPAEGKKFSMVDKNWRKTMGQAKNNAKVIDFCDNEDLLQKFRESEVMLDQVQKGLSDYLETKRSVFARFYFLSNDELLSILSESKDVKRVQPHLKKCFEGIDKVHFEFDLKITSFISPESEEVQVTEVIDPVGKNVEVWMLELEGMMRISIRAVMKKAIDEYLTTPRPEWMQQHAGMCVLNGSQMHWTTEMEELFEKEGSNGPKLMLERQVAQLADMTILVRGNLSKAARTTVGALTVIDVHARDVIKKLADQHVDNKHNFGWTSQLRYYWEGGDDGDLWAQMVAAKRPYGYEYLGNTFRLVITPLTDKCYLTLMGALQMIFGGAPAGPAGTGKTETTKDLAKALAMQCVVFNCSDGLDYVAMGKFFKGLAACGAWACFDEFNRINIEVLSVIGQQIMSIQMVIKAGENRMLFEGSDIFVSERFAVFITMNPGYAGRSALPDSLQALFRPVAMMVPDYALIGEIMFFAYGFEFAKECGAKMVTTFKLCSEQLSSQPHYDYGMRAVKTVITAAGNLKRAEPHADEMVLLLRALQDVNIPKFLEMDLPLFAGIISDLFPGKKRPQLDYGALMRTMKEEIAKFGLQPKDFFISKVIQLYEMIVVRHGLMLVGPTGGGKSSNLHTLQNTLGSLKQQGIEGFAYEKVFIFQLNPKSITMGQMYGLLCIVMLP